MPIPVVCPSCGRIGKAPDQAIGRTARCPACKNTYVLTADLVQPDDQSPRAPMPTLAKADDIYGLDPALVERPKRPAPRPPVVPVPAASARPEREGGVRLPVSAIVGGVIGVALLSALGAWGLSRLGEGRAPVAEAVQPVLAAQAPAPARLPVEPVQAEALAGAGEVSVAAMLSLDDTPAAPPAAEPGGESDVAVKARMGAAAVAASNGEAGKTLTTAEIVEESEPSVALIKGKGSSGTGFLVGPGLIATNAHVIDDEFASDLEVQFVSADEAHSQPIRAELLYEDPERDLAFLAVKSDLKPLRVAKSYTFRKGEDVTVIGNPGMGDGQVLENAISRGVMSTKAKIDDKNFYQLNIAINPGNSGGTVFDPSGRVIGVATLKSSKQEATGFSIPIEDLQAAIAKVAAQTTAEAEKYRSKHRSKMVVKSMGGGGAILCFLIDLRKADAQAKSPALKEVLNKIETVADVIEKELMPTLATEGPIVRKDMALETPVRNMINEMSDNFMKLRTATSNKKGVDDRQLRIMKQNHRRLITALSTSLKIEFPKEMMVAFDDHIPSQPNIVTMSPANLGSYSSRLRPRTPGGISRPPSARDRLQQRKNGGR